MAMFNTKAISDLYEKIKELKELQKKNESDKAKLLEIVQTLKIELADAIKRSPEYEKEAKQASRKTTEYRNRAEDNLNDSATLLIEIESKRNEVLIVSANVNHKSVEVNDILNWVKHEKDNIDILIDDASSRITNIEKVITAYEEVIERHPDFEEEIAELEVNLTNIRSNESKSNQLVRAISNKRVELDSVYNELLGYNQVDEETGDEVFVNGTRQNLEESFEGLDGKFEELEESYQTLEKDTLDKFEQLSQSNLDRVNNLLETNSGKIATQIKSWEDKYSALNKKIEDLLPNALTAGLSAAFAAKNKTEITLYDKHKKQFVWGIIGMITVSIIPFIISIFTLLNDHKFDVVIDRAPKIVIAILPLYIPVLWLSISSSKKMNLSKRLIEEYSHKEVLSKTFEGLSRQIKEVGDDGISNELKIKLLQDFMEMYSENPGKLISDYSSSDHPIMELLESSNKLEKTISRVKKMPGLGKLATLTKEKKDKELEEKGDLVEAAIERITELNEEEEDEQNV